MLLRVRCHEKASKPNMKKILGQQKYRFPRLREPMISGSEGLEGDLHIYRRF